MEDLDIKHLLPEKLFFFTVKDTKWQKMDKVRKHILKISKWFVIVREENKATSGYHFHALFRSKDAPKRNWFRRGVHMNLRQYGKFGSMTQSPGPVQRPPIDISFSQNEIIGIADEKIQHDLMRQLTIDRAMNSIHRMDAMLKKEAQARRCLAYMSKALTPISSRYTDYYIKL